MKGSAGSAAQAVLAPPQAPSQTTIAAAGPSADDRKEEEARRATATERAALSYLRQKRGGNTKASVKDCCDAAAAETGYPRPAETSVRRLLPRFMTDGEKAEKRRQDEKNELRAVATRAAATLYRQMNGDGDGDVVMSVTRCCASAGEQHGIRPAETSVRRVLARMYEEEGIEPKKKKAKPNPKSALAQCPSVPDQNPQLSAQHDLEVLQAYQPDQHMVLPGDYPQGYIPPQSVHEQNQEVDLFNQPLDPADQSMVLATAAEPILRDPVPPDMPPMSPPEDLEADVDVIAI